MKRAPLDPFALLARQLAGLPIPAAPAMPGRKFLRVAARKDESDPRAEAWDQRHAASPDAWLQRRSTRNSY